jgi:hypothetical protein
MSILNPKGYLSLALLCSLTVGTTMANAAYGDLNNDGFITYDDINKVYWYTGTKGDSNYNPDADINHDNMVNEADADLLYNIMNGDLNSDGTITWDDINKVYWYFGIKGDENYNENADINKDNIVNSSDADILHAFMNANLTTTPTLETTQTPVDPEPTTTVTTLLGDLDGDGVITWDDINRVYWYFGVLGDENYNEAADINGDHIVNSADADLLTDLTHPSSTEVP